MIFEEPNP